MSTPEDNSQALANFGLNLALGDCSAESMNHKRGRVKHPGPTGVDQRGSSSSTSHLSPCFCSTTRTRLANVRGA